MKNEQRENESMKGMKCIDIILQFFFLIIISSVISSLHKKIKKRRKRKRTRERERESYIFIGSWSLSTSEGPINDLN